MSKHAIKYQETEVPAERSIGQITTLIREYGGTRFEQIWGEDGRVLGIRFAIRHPQIGELPVSLTTKYTQIERILHEAGLWRSMSNTRRSERIGRQAERIAWRHTKDLTEQLLLSVRLGLRTLPAAFMADVEVLDEHTGETVTMFELFERSAELSASGRSIELTVNRTSGEVRALPPGSLSENRGGA